MSPAEVVIGRLETIGAVTALVGTRIYQFKLPQKPTLPAIRVQNIDYVDTYHLRGESQPLIARVQVDVYAAESSGVDALEQVHSIADAIHGDGCGRDATGLSGWIGELGSPTITVWGMFRKAREDTFEGNELRVVRTRQDYMVHMT